MQLVTVWIHAILRNVASLHVDAGVKSHVADTPLARVGLIRSAVSGGRLLGDSCDSNGSKLPRLAELLSVESSAGGTHADF